MKDLKVIYWICIVQINDVNYRVGSSMMSLNEINFKSIKIEVYLMNFEIFKCNFKCVKNNAINIKNNQRIISNTILKSQEPIKPSTVTRIEFIAATNKRE